MTLNGHLGGTDTFTKRSLRGLRWGETAIIGGLVSDSDWLNPERFMIGEAAPHQGMYGIGSQVYPSVAQYSCNPKCSVQTTNMKIVSDPTPEGNGCDGVYEITGCEVPGGLASACITTTTTAANGSSTRTDCVLLSGGGTWVGEQPPDTYCPFDCCYLYPEGGDWNGDGSGIRILCYHRCSIYWTPETAGNWDELFASLGYTKIGENSYKKCWEQSYVCL